MNIEAQVFITFYPLGMFVHALSITPDGWRQVDASLDMAQLDSLVDALLCRGFIKQPSTGYLLIFAKLAKAG